MSSFIRQQITGYNVEQMLGDGGVGIVYQAVAPASGAPVAVKLLHATLGQDAHAALLEQARQSQRLAHPSIVPSLDAGVVDNHTYLISELRPLGSLGQWLMELRYRRETLSWEVTLEIMMQLASGLHAAHEIGILHGHLSLENVLRVDELTVQISDFGLWLPSQLADDEAAWVYAAPEQLVGAQGDVRSDIYSLGVLFYELVVGEPPFDPDSFEEAQRLHTTEDPEEPRARLADLSGLINEIILHMLEKDSADRPNSMLDVIQTLEFVIGDGTVSAVALVAGPQNVSDNGTQLDVTKGIDATLVEFNDQWEADEDRVTISRSAPIVHGLGDKDIVTIGRSSTCDIVLDHPSISSQHASLRRISGGWEVRDLGSRNGVYINRTQLLADVAEIWENHQTLRLGPYYFRLQIVPRDIKQRDVDLELGPTRAEVVLGQSVEVDVILLNHGAQRDYVKLRVEGAEASWMTLAQDTVEIMPNERAVVKLKMRPPRLRNELVMQAHPYKLIATSLLRERDPIDGEGQVYVQASHSVYAALFPDSHVNNGTFKLNIRNDGALPLNFQIRSRQPDTSLRFGPWTAEGVLISTTSLAVTGDPLGTLGDLLSSPRQALQQNRIWRGLRRFPGVSHITSAFRQLPFVRTLQGAERSVEQVQHQQQQVQQALDTIRGDSQTKQAPKTDTPPAREGTFGIERVQTQQVGVQQETAIRPFVEANLQIASHHEAEWRVQVEADRPYFGRPSTHPFELELSIQGDQPKLHKATLHIKPRFPLWVLWIISGLLFALVIAILVIFQPVRIFGLLDTDNDLLRDSTELYSYQTDARLADSDGDGLTDGLEIAVALDPLQADSDGDGLFDGQERIDLRNGVEGFPLTPRQFRRFDADLDGQIDQLVGVNIFESSAFEPDSDGDGFLDGLEVRTCHNPLRIDPGPVLINRCPLPVPVASRQSAENEPAPRQLITHIITATAVADTGVSFVLGDDAANVRSNHQLTFDLSELPATATLYDIQLVTTFLTRKGQLDDLGIVMIDLMAGDIPQITRFAQLQPSTTSPLRWQADLRQLVGLINAQDVLTLRLAATLANNKDNDPDQLTFADANSDRPPYLIVVYEVEE